jgi:hypothetical protein
MQAIEFETIIDEGWLKVPSIYQDWEGKRVKVIVLSSTEPEMVSTPTKTNAALSKLLGIARVGCISEASYTEI